MFEIFSTSFKLGYLSSSFIVFLDILFPLFAPQIFFSSSSKDETQKSNLKLEKALSSLPFLDHMPHGTA